MSDVYQDLFDEGSFIGKGIYDVDAFERALAGRFPENRILSHDLLEGCYARAGLLSDVRSLRGVSCPLQRGCQLAGTAGFAATGNSCDGHWQAFPAPARSSNATRSRRFRDGSYLTIFAAVSIPAVAHAAAAPRLDGATRAWFWTMARHRHHPASFIAYLVASMSCTNRPTCARTTSRPRPPSCRARHCAQACIALSCACPTKRSSASMRFVRTMARMRITHRRQLEWNPSSAISRRNEADEPRSAFSRRMWAAPALALVTARTRRNAACSRWLGPLRFGLWCISPAIAWWVSRPLAAEAPRSDAEQTDFPAANVAQDMGVLRNICHVPKITGCRPTITRRIRSAIVGHRTSPTNMGLALLRILRPATSATCHGTAGRSARDNALHTMGALERYRGHFYNWYDTNLAARSCRCMFRPSTAATSQAIC